MKLPCVYLYRYFSRVDTKSLFEKNMHEFLITLSSVQSVLSNSLWLHGLQHTGLSVYHQLLELAQTPVHWVGDAIQPSYPLLSPSPPTFNLSQHWGLFKWITSLHQVAKVLFLAIFFRKDSTLKFSIICLSVFFLNWFFWRIIALHNFAVFCQTST